MKAFLNLAEDVFPPYLNYSLWYILWKVVLFSNSLAGIAPGWSHGWICRRCICWTAWVGGLCWFNAGLQDEVISTVWSCCLAISFLNTDHFWPCSVSYCEASLQPYFGVPTLPYTCFVFSCFFLLWTLLKGPELSTFSCGLLCWLKNLECIILCLYNYTVLSAVHFYIWVL